MGAEVFISTWGNVCIWLCILFQEAEINLAVKFC